MKKTLILTIIFGLFLNFSAWASMVSFFVIETGLPEERGVIRQSILWENAFLDVFFESGYIVSNAPILTLERIPSDILRVIDIEEAIRGGVEVMVIARLDYIPDSQSPRNVTLFVYNLTPHRKTFERQFPGSSRDIEEIKTLVRGLIPYVG